MGSLQCETSILCRFATFVTALAAKAVDMGLELNYNSRVVRMYAMEDGTFTLQTSAGRVRAPPPPTLCPPPPPPPPGLALLRVPILILSPSDIDQLVW